MAMIVDAFVSQVADTVATLIKDEVMMLIGVKAELRQLEKKLRTIRNVLEDAEWKAITDSAVCAWLAQLKDVVYDADDVIDHCRTHAEQLARLSSDETGSVNGCSFRKVNIIYYDGKPTYNIK